MAVNKHLRISAARWGAVALLVIAALGAGVLVAQAYEHTTPIPHPGQAAPVPTFSLGVQTPTPSPTHAPVLDRAVERFLTVGTGAGSNVWWRGVAGACGGAAPVVERSTDGGATWTNVTPPGIAQLASIEVFDQTEADLVVGVGPNCEPQALRTFTQGQFWESFPETLAQSRFIGLADPATVVTPGGPVAAPCRQASGLRADGDVAALVCDGIAYVVDSNGGAVALPPTHAAAVAIEGDAVIVGHSIDGCTGLTVTRFSNGGTSSSQCVEGSDAEATVIAASAGDTLVWTGDAILVAP